MVDLHECSHLTALMIARLKHLAAIILVIALNR